MQSLLRFRDSVIGYPSTSKANVAKRSTLHDRYRSVRQTTDIICQPLTPEDCVIQSMPDASPIRWHLAHTTWFFETFVLKAAIPNYKPFDPAFEVLFNSYYNQVGKQFPRSQRGLLSRPGLAEVTRYRQTVDQAIGELFEEPNDQLSNFWPIVELGLHHEQQHQELMLTDVKHLLSCNPCWPAYHSVDSRPDAPASSVNWIPGSEGVRWIGHHGDDFAYDNESPHHEVLVPAHELASRLVTNGEFLEFMGDQGYQRPELWLSLGWQMVGEHAWDSPLYWTQLDGKWHQFGLGGLKVVRLDEPVCHVSYFEADAFARWAGHRLPTEAEWELAAMPDRLPIEGNFSESRLYHPMPATSDSIDCCLQQMYGDAWEWTSSPYSAYPGYQAPPGAIGEYNGKFMCNQYVLRGGSCATSQTHIRPTYRNFFPPEARWQFTGIRLAR